MVLHSTIWLIAHVQPALNVPHLWTQTEHNASFNCRTKIMGLNNITRFRLGICVFFCLCYYAQAMQGLPSGTRQRPHRPPVYTLQSLHVMYTTTDNSRKGCPQTYCPIRPLSWKPAIVDTCACPHTPTACEIGIWLLFMLGQSLNPLQFNKKFLTSPLDHLRIW